MTPPLWQKSKEELKSLLKKVKEESEKVVLKLNIQKTKIMASGSITSWQIDGKTMEIETDFIFCIPPIKVFSFLGCTRTGPWLLLVGDPELPFSPDPR